MGKQQFSFAGIGDIGDDVLKNADKLDNNVNKIIEDIKNPNVNNNGASNSGRGVKFDEIKFNEKFDDLAMNHKTTGLPTNQRGNNSGYTGGRSKEELQKLALDPSKNFKLLDEQAIKERAIGLELEENGLLKNIKRDTNPNGGAEFIDSDGTKWDVKSFLSYPRSGCTSPRKGAFSLEKAIKNINKELEKGYNVIIDVTDLIPEHIIQLKNKLLEEGMIHRIIWYPPYFN